MHRNNVSTPANIKKKTPLKCGGKYKLQIGSTEKVEFKGKMFLDGVKKHRRTALFLYFFLIP